jgi:hypothetical protein
MINDQREEKVIDNMIINPEVKISNTIINIRMKKTKNLYEKNKEFKLLDKNITKTNFQFLFASF